MIMHKKPPLSMVRLLSVRRSWKKAVYFSLLLGLSVAGTTFPISAAEASHPAGIDQMLQAIGQMPGRNIHGVSRQWHDVPYADQSPAQKLDIFLPDTGEGPYPVILAIHGGGFMGGDKDSGEVNAEMTGLTRGYAVVTVNYRLSGEAPFPAAVYDVKAAVRFLKAHASEYQLDPDRIAAWGDSAGGNLASMLGTTGGHGELEDFSMGNADQDSRVRCVVDWFGPTDFSQMDKLFAAGTVKASQQHDDAASAESKYMGAAITTIPNLVRFADPQSYISSSTVPFFIENGSQDDVVPTQQSILFAEKLKQAIGEDKVTYIQLAGARHGGSEFETEENLNKVFTFLDTYMK